MIIPYILLSYTLNSIYNNIYDQLYILYEININKMEYNI